MNGVSKKPKIGGVSHEKYLYGKFLERGGMSRTEIAKELGYANANVWGVIKSNFDKVEGRHTKSNTLLSYSRKRRLMELVELVHELTRVIKEMVEGDENV